MKDKAGGYRVGYRGLYFFYSLEGHLHVLLSWHGVCLQNTPFTWALSVQWLLVTLSSSLEVMLPQTPSFEREKKKLPLMVVNSPQQTEVCFPTNSRLLWSLLFIVNCAPTLGYLAKLWPNRSRLWQRSGESLWVCLYLCFFPERYKICSTLDSFSLFIL